MHRGTLIPKPHYGCRGNGKIDNVFWIINNTDPSPAALLAEIELACTRSIDSEVDEGVTLPADDEVVREEEG